MNIRGKVLEKYKVPHKPHNIEAIFIELNLRKIKWLLFELTSDFPLQNDQFYFEVHGKDLVSYSSYDRIVLAGDFNHDEKKVCMEAFLHRNYFKILVKESTCCENSSKPTTFDLFSNSF